MPKPTDYDKTHLRNMAAIGTRIDRIFKKAAEEAAKIGVSIKSLLPEDRIFSFDDYPETKKQIERLMTALQESMETAIVNGVRSSWTLSNNKNNSLVSRIFGDRVGDLSKEQYRRYFSTNGAALDAFLQRKEQGLNLSDRVWRYTNAFKREIELGLDLGIRTGESADKMSRSLRQYLQHPDKLFRRVRDKHGNLKLSKAARDYHPGRGVYRSSYKNARRLACTETNIAYRTSDHLRWQQMDFVVGIEIKLSNNHTLNGAPLTDICDTLKGKYPKDFKFVGWHPHCRCHAVTVLKTEEELADDTQCILAGRRPTKSSVNTVSDVPDAFKNWIEEHADRINLGGTMPYFIKDNQKLVARILAPESAKTVEIAEEITELRRPKVKATPLVQDFLADTQAGRYADKYREIHDAVEHWREGMEESDIMLQLIENSAYEGELFRGMSFSQKDFMRFRMALDSNRADVTSILNRDAKLISWTKSDKVAREYYGTAKADEPVRVIIRMRSTKVRGYDNSLVDLWGVQDKEVTLSQYTKFKFRSARVQTDALGKYTEIIVEPINESRIIKQAKANRHDYEPVSLETLRQDYEVTFRKGVPLTAYYKGIARTFNFPVIKDQVTQALSDVGINISRHEAIIHGEDYFCVHFEGRDKGGKRFALTRTFTDRGKDGIEVHHELFELPISAQGKGTSKRVLGMFYEEYKRMGITEITVDANIDVGGYTWARYGFNALNKREAMSAVNVQEAWNFIDNYYKENGLPDYKPFPMYMLTEQPWGKRALLGSFWRGTLNLNDPTQVAQFEKYLGLR